MLPVSYRRAAAVKMSAFSGRRINKPNILYNKESCFATDQVIFSIRNGVVTGLLGRIPFFDTESIRFLILPKLGALRHAFLL